MNAVDIHQTKPASGTIAAAAAAGADEDEEDDDDGDGVSICSVARVRCLSSFAVDLARPSCLSVGY